MRKGGWFVTKVFRSKDYNSLLWVFQQLFKNVHATKPQASRNESAEIFVVCQNYMAPDRIDPKFLDPKAVFKEIEDEPTQSINLIHPEKHTRHRGGYPEGDYTLFHTLNVSEFISNENYLQLLADASEIIFDDEEIENNESTTDEIKECLKDIKVLGKREIRLVINWRKKLKQELEDKKKLMKTEVNMTEKVEPETDSEDDLAALEEKLNELEGEEKKALKRKIKKTRRERARLQRKMDMKLVLPEDEIDMTDDKDLFDLVNIKSKRQLEKVEEGNLSDFDEDDEKEDAVPKKKLRVSWDRDGIKTYQLRDEGSDQDDEDENEDDDETKSEGDDDISLDEADVDDVNPLLIGRQDSKAKTDMWFSKDSFASLDDDEDEDVEIEQMAKAYSEKGGVIKGMNDNMTEDMIIPEEKVGDIKKTKVDKEKKVEEKDSAIEMESGDESDSDSSESEGSETDSDSDYDTREFYKQQTKANKEKTKETKGKKSNKNNDFEEVPAEDVSAMKLNAQGLALGSALVSSRKRRREVIESGYHRYMFNDTNLPDWFEKDEKKHHRIRLPVTKGDMQEYRLKMKAVDANPIKKIAEAKARKKRKQAKRLEKARKKADAINDTEEVTDREKWQQIKQVYKKAGLLNNKKKEVTYVIAKKGLAGKRVSRPQGVKGPFKVVDGRLKKDSRAQRRSEQRKKGKGKGKRR